MKRKNLKIDRKIISYLDNEKNGQAMICLHGHFGCASMFSFMNSVHNGRLILIDQQGHGLSGRGTQYRTIDYIKDLDDIINHEDLNQPIILGHSLGGLNAYFYAAIHKNIKSLIIEDIGTEVACSNEFILKLPPEFCSLYEVQKEFEKIGMSFDQYFIESLRYDGEHWKFIFDYYDMVKSQQEMNGTYWEYWEKIECPILLLHGRKSWACKTENIVEMAQRNANTRLIIYENAGHTIHDEYREKFCTDIQDFIKIHEND